MKTPARVQPTPVSAPAVPALPSGGPVLPGTEIPPSGPSATAGQPITTGRRLPPGIPAHMADMVTSPGGPAQARAPVLDVVIPTVHPTFGGTNTSRRVHREAAAKLSTGLASAVQALCTFIGHIVAAEDYLKANPEAAKDFAAEDLDMGRVAEFREGLVRALDATTPAAPAD